MNKNKLSKVLMAAALGTFAVTAVSLIDRPDGARARQRDRR